jgi:hypothetical protein
MEDFVRKKYPKTLHLPWSRKVTLDDKVMRAPALKAFHGRRVVVSEKLDGENTTMYQDIIHARSVDGRFHPSRNWVKVHWESIRYDIPLLWRVCGENMYAMHSIFYDSLKSYFYGFSVWNDQNVALSWDDTLDWFGLLGITPAPVLYDGIYDEEIIRGLWTEGDWARVEGYVMRVADPIPFDDFHKMVGKFVRPNHVQTSEHWMSNAIVPNLLAAP